MASRLLTRAVEGCSFAFFTDDEIRKISVKRITNPNTFDAFNHPTPGCVPYVHSTECAAVATRFA